MRLFSHSFAGPIILLSAFFLLVNGCGDHPSDAIGVLPTVTPSIGSTYTMVTYRTANIKKVDSLYREEINHDTYTVTRMYDTYRGAENVYEYVSNRYDSAIDGYDTILVSFSDSGDVAVYYDSIRYDVDNKYYQVWFDLPIATKKSGGSQVTPVLQDTGRSNGSVIWTRDLSVYSYNNGPDVNPAEFSDLSGIPSVDAEIASTPNLWVVKTSHNLIWTTRYYNSSDTLQLDTVETSGIYRFAPQIGFFERLETESKILFSPYTWTYDRRFRAMQVAE